MTALTLKYNDKFREVFEYLYPEMPADITAALKKAEQVYNKVLAGMKLPGKVKSIPLGKVKPVLKHRRTPAQKKADIVLKDRMETAKLDMIDHISREIKYGSYTYQEFLADPSAYFSTDIMGNYKRNTRICQAIIKYFETEFIPF